MPEKKSMDKTFEEIWNEKVEKIFNRFRKDKETDIIIDEEK